MTEYRNEVIRRLAEAQGINRPMATELLAQIERGGLRVELDDEPIGDERELA